MITEDEYINYLRRQAMAKSTKPKPSKDKQQILWKILCCGSGDHILVSADKDHIVDIIKKYASEVCPLCDDEEWQNELNDITKLISLKKFLYDQNIMIDKWKPKNNSVIVEMN